LLQVGDELRVLVIKVDAARSRITVSTKELELKFGDFLTLSRQEFCDRAEERAAAWLDRVSAASLREHSMVLSLLNL
jgi:transcriptional accessory protein Tex/SPT6